MAVRVKMRVELGEDSFPGVGVAGSDLPFLLRESCWEDDGFEEKSEDGV
jgi:hypothetical protein